MYEQHVPRTNNAGAATPGGVVARGLGKRYGDHWALRDVDLDVPRGTVLGLLGHNGAGKTTLLRILTTLAAPTTGRGAVAGHDVVTAADQVRACIGVAGQAATVDDLLTARANLEMVARLYHLPRATARARAAALLAEVDLTADADRLVRTFSGGMRRRLDLAAALIAAPPVIFLDEPTTGLDPHSRNQLWDLLRAQVRAGATLVLTTQYLDEADRLADHVVVLDHGAVVARGTPAELKAAIGGDRLVATAPGQLAAAAAALAPFADAAPAIDEAAGQVTIRARAGVRLVEVVRALDAAGVDAQDVHRREATLDDVFLAITRKGGAA